jgi:gentisate 1,2-dioxygenase
MATPEFANIESLERYMAEHNFAINRYLPTEPPVLRPFHWRWAEMEPAILGLAKLMPLATSEEDRRNGVLRRTVQRVNPRNSKGARLPLALSVQSVLPGEQAISHRHSAGATRFVIKGSASAYTLVHGEPFPLEEGDFITTPQLTWHGHVNESDNYVLWLDGLDSRYAGHGATFHEEWPDAYEPVHHERIYQSIKTLGAHLRLSSYPEVTHPAGPGVKHAGDKHPPGFRYSWQQTSATLGAMKENEDEPDPFDCYTVTYSHPLTGGATFPTTANEMTLLAPGFRGRDHRHNSTVIYHAFRGRGVMVVEGERFEWSKGDFVELPAWTTHRHENPFGEDAFLYSFTDWPAQKALGQFFYEEF